MASRARCLPTTIALLCACAQPRPRDRPPAGAPTIGLPSERSAGAGADADGGLTRAQVNRIVRAHMNELSACHAANRPAPSGVPLVVELGWTIDEGGRVQGATVHDVRPPTGDALAACLVARIRAWSFPAGPRPTVVPRYPIHFGPAHD